MGVGKQRTDRLKSPEGVALDTECFDAFVRSLSAVPRRTAVGSALGAGLAALFGRYNTDDAAAKRKNKKRKKKKKCRGNKKKCGKACIPQSQCCGGCDEDQQCCDGACIPETDCCGCSEDQVCCEGTCAGCCTDNDCPVSQACLDGACGCPEAACEAATDPTDDQFESCFCALATDGEAHCFANIFCAEPPPTCQEASECAGGAVCLAIGCQAVSRCSPVCALR